MSWLMLYGIVSWLVLGPPVQARGTEITDAGLKGLAPLQNLATLYLSATKVTGVRLKELAGLKNLTTLSLGYTRATDAGLNSPRSRTSPHST